MNSLEQWLGANRAFLVTLLLLAATGFLSFRIADVAQEGTKQAVRCKREWARQKNAFLPPADRDTVLFFGNSTMGAGIIPELFDAENNNTTYAVNFSLPALPLAPHYFLLKDFLKNHPPPRYIIMTLSPEGFSSELFPYYAVLNASLPEIAQYALLRKNADIIVNFILPWKLYWPEVKRYAIGKMIMAMPQGWKEAIRKKYADRGAGDETYRHGWEKLFDLRYIAVERSAREREKILKDGRGYYFIAEQSIMGGAMPADYAATEANGQEEQKILPPEAAFKESEMHDPFISRFFDLARSRNITVIRKSPAPAGSPGLWKFLKSKYPNIYFSPDHRTPRLYAPRYFSDPVHVNQAGAERFTKEIAQEFREALR